MQFTKSLLISMLFSFLYLNGADVESEKKSKDFNISINAVYYSPGFLLMEPTGGVGIIFNYKCFRTSFNYTRTEYYQQKGNFYEINVGGQYDFIKSDKMDSVILGDVNFNVASGLWHKIDWADDESPFFESTDFFISTSIGYEYSIGTRNLKFNIGTITYLPVFLVLGQNADKKISSGCEYGIPGIKIYVGFKF